MFAACSVGKITGEVDGDLVPAFNTGIVYEANQLTADDDVVAVAAFYTFGGGCDLVAEQMDVKADGIRGLVDGKDVEKLIDDVKAFEDDNMPEDYWAAYVILAGENENDIEDDFKIDDGDETAVLVCHHTGGVDAPREEPQAALLPDYGAAFFKDSNRDCFVANEGEVRVSLYDGKSISLVAEVELVDADDDDAGEVELGALAAHCPATESAVDGLLEEASDLVAADGAAGGNDSCQFANDGECDHPGVGTGACEDGTDISDC
ncbi:MAG: hypothetical protein HYS27_22960 [Deltaproteobacteria bacterium]|nr:hypothetical protein [Deltaproteobacteria bacterium]